MEEKEKKEEQEEDILLKLSMPGKSLRKGTLQKARAASASPEHPDQNTLAPQKPEEAKEEDILTQLSMPERARNAPVPVKEDAAEQKDLVETVDVKQVEQLAERIFNSDYGKKKKKP